MTDAITMPRGGVEVLNHLMEGRSAWHGWEAGHPARSQESHDAYAERERSDALDALVTRIGCRVLEGEEFVLAQLGHVQAEMRRLKALERDLVGKARPFDGRTA